MISIIDDDKREVKVERQSRIALYSKSISTSTSRGLVSPFISFLAIRSMSASSSDLGWLESIANLLSTFFSPLFGKLSDLFRRRIPFIIFSSALWGIPYILLYWANSPLFFILIVAFVNILFCIGISPWNALQNDIFPPKIRAELTSKIYLFDALGTMISTVFTGIVLTLIFHDLDYQKYILIPVSVGIFLSFLGIIPFFKMKEPIREIKGTMKKLKQRKRTNFKIIFKNKAFVKYAIISMTFSFSMSMCWPLFPIKQVTILDATAIDISIFRILFSLAAILFLQLGARLSDRIGRTKLIFFARLVQSFFPVFFIIATKMWHIFLVQFVFCSLIMSGYTSFQAYLLDIIPKEEGGMYFGFFNMFDGLALFAGSLFGGYMQLFLESKYSLEVALTISLGIAAILRFLSSLAHLTLKEESEFPDNFTSYVKSLFSERKKKTKGKKITQT